MGDTTRIAWADKTWNPWQGCTKVSPACKHCYMFREKKRFGQDPRVVVRSQAPTFKKPLAWKTPALVFTCSWSDWFHAAADAWRAEAWAIVRRTPHLTYQILTKRPERIAAHLPADWGTAGYPNVWLGVSVETQRQAHRIRLLAAVPAAVRFVSAEPLLGPLTLGAPLPGAPGSSLIDAVDWLIVGGESGGSADEVRPMSLDWVRVLRDECAARSVPFFLKQLGGYPDARSHAQAVLDGRTHTEWPHGT